MTKEELYKFVHDNTPIIIESKRKTKHRYVSPFTSYYAFDEVVDHLTNKIWKKYFKDENRNQKSTKRTRSNY